VNKDYHFRLTNLRSLISTLTFRGEYKRTVKLTVYTKRYASTVNNDVDLLYYSTYLDRMLTVAVDGRCGWPRWPCGVHRHLQWTSLSSACYTDHAEPSTSGAFMYARRPQSETSDSTVQLAARLNTIVTEK